MRILITGATGFLGHRVTAALLADGHTVCAVVRASAAGAARHGELRGVTPLVDDGHSDLAGALQRVGPCEGVVHLASLFLASHRPADITPLLTSNLLFPVRLLDAAARSGARWFVNTGSVWQHYGGRDYSPVNLYAATKQAFETLAQYYVEAHGLRFATLALGDTYGPGDVRPKLLNLWCRAAADGKPLAMSGGHQPIDPIEVTDVAAAYVALVGQIGGAAWEAPPLATFAVSSGTSRSLRELAAQFEAATGRSLSLRWGARPDRPREMTTPWQGAPCVPGWRPQVPLREGLARLWQAYAAAVPS